MIRCWRKAKKHAAAQAGVVTDALERIVETNTYLSGIGFESSGGGRRARDSQRFHHP